MTTRVEVYQNNDDLCLAAAEHWLASCAASLQRQDHCHIALAGGSTPKALYQLLAQPEFQQRMDWQRVHIYFGDERHVPPDDPQSNYRMAREALLDKVAIPPQQCHPIPWREDAKQAAGEYAQILKDQLPVEAGLPRFDMIWLGMGDDGHTASLFPGTTILQEFDNLCAATYVDKLNTWRVSLTYPVLNNAERVFLLVSGAGKAERLAEILRAQPMDYPVAKVHPQGQLNWLLDNAAAADLDWSAIPAAWTVQR